MIEGFIIIFMLILLSALFSGTETAYTSLTFLQIRELKAHRGRRGKLAASLAEKPDILLTTILIGNNLVNIAASAITTTTVIRLYGSYAVGIATGILTLVILIFAEITPKQIAIIHNETISRFMALPVKILTYLLYPLIISINWVSSLITRIFAGDKRSHISLDGILHAVNIAQDQGIVEDYENRFVQNVFRFDDVDVHTIMTHRTDVFSVEMHRMLSSVMAEVVHGGYSRVPVYDTTPEHIVGVLLTRDLMRQIVDGKGEGAVSEIMLEPLFVPETRKVHEMFFKFKQSKLHLAIVLDEYGGLAGVVTLEDVIEELFGELYDEHESGVEERISELENGTYRIVGETSIQQLEDILGTTIEHSRHVGTVGGYISESLGTIPHTGQHFDAPFGTFRIEKMRGNRIETVLFEPALGETLSID